jgi:hypothetical protein
MECFRREAKGNSANGEVKGAATAEGDAAKAFAFGKLMIAYWDAHGGDLLRLRNFG